MIVWGGAANGFSTAFNNGGRYNPAANSWRPIFAYDIVGRFFHTAVWTGGEMIVWGGITADFNTFLNDGARYNPADNTWKLMSNTGAPTARWQHTAVWTGSEMIIWGGEADGKGGSNDTFSYSPARTLYLYQRQ
jgi:N-acetylneuraminic acid mutarotase